MAADDASTPSAKTQESTGYFPAATALAATKFKTLKNYTESLLPTRESKPEIVFPPPSWDIKDLSPGPLDFNIPEPAHETPSKEDGPSTNDPSEEEKEEEHPEPEEPLTFAKKLRTMIELLPVPGSLVPDALSTRSNSKTEAPTNNTTESKDSTETPPIPPGMDPKLIKMLSSEEVMNGDSKGKERPSIWSLLSGMRSGGESKSEKPEAQGTPVEERDSGVMMYAPLIPQSDSVVELAHTETLQSNESSKPSTGASSSKPASPAPKEITVWVPSTTEMSVLTTWWGYRLYLPPPVMGKLGDSTVKAAARAAMITSALKWLIDRVPMLVIPVQFRPAMKALRSLTPFAGYVGVFIAWSWDRIRTFDEGNGVVLTASWILPVALVPMAWDAGDIYGPRLPPEIEEKKEKESEKKKEKSAGKKSRFVW